MLKSCEICGLKYAPVDNRKHISEHRKFLKLSERFAVPRFGQHLWINAEREANKNPDKRSIEDCERHLYALFCRCVLAHDTTKHPTFEDYAAIILEGPLVRICGDFGRKMRELYPRQLDNCWTVDSGCSYAGLRDRSVLTARDCTDD